MKSGRNIYLEDELFVRLKVLAARKRVTISGLAEGMIRRGVEEEEKKLK